MTEDLQTKIKRVYEMMDCLDDVESAKVSVGFLRAVLERLADLQDKLAAVPVAALRRWYENSNPQLMEYEFISDVETDAEFIEAWLGTQVEP